MLPKQRNVIERAASEYIETFSIILFKNSFKNGCKNNTRKRNRGDEARIFFDVIIRFNHTFRRRGGEMNFSDHQNRPRYASTSNLLLKRASDGFRVYIR